MDRGSMGGATFVQHPEALAADFRAQGWWRDETLNDLLDARAAATSDRVFVSDADGRSLTYAGMAAAAQRLANALLALGLRKGDVVGIQLPSSIEFLVAYFGVTRMGAVLSPMHMPYEESELRPLLAFSGARAVICAAPDDRRDRPAMMARLRDALPALQHVIQAHGEPADGSILGLDAICARAGTEARHERPAAGDPALLCFTSGTSSAPKAVIHASETLLADARVYIGTIGASAGDHAMIAPPFTHIFGLECVNNALASGGSVVPLARFTPQAFAELIERQRPTIVYGAPAHLAATLSENQLAGRDLSSVRHVILGGSICPPSVAEAFERCLPNGRVGILFGMTESLLVTQTRPAAGPEERHATVGRPIPGIEVRVVDDGGTALGPGREGALQLRGYTIMSGYAGNPAANARAFTADGWFNTGDMATIDRHGNVVITGRATDVINRGGVKINPADIESVIARHPDVIDVALIPKPDAILGERICAVLTVRPGRTVDVGSLGAFLESEGVARMRHPEFVVIVDEMPMTPTRKIIKGQLAKTVFPGEPSARGHA
jgi:acyl-CoA synthetase (AMP-forming)/AMP-acid ligase II